MWLPELWNLWCRPVGYYKGTFSINFIFSASRLYWLQCSGIALIALQKLLLSFFPFQNILFYLIILCNIHKIQMTAGYRQECNCPEYPLCNDCPASIYNLVVVLVGLSWHTLCTVGSSRSRPTLSVNVLPRYGQTPKISQLSATIFWTSLKCNMGLRVN